MKQEFPFCRKGNQGTVIMGNQPVHLQPLDEPIVNSPETPELLVDNDDSLSDLEFRSEIHSAMDIFVPKKLRTLLSLTNLGLKSL